MAELDMGASFAAAFDYMIGHEDSQRSWKETSDNRGQVIAGINSLAFPEEFAAIQALPQERRGPAIALFYFNHVWIPNFGRVRSRRVSSKLLDMAVNMGLHEAVVLCQRAVNQQSLTAIKVDGIFGGATLFAVNQLAEQLLLPELADQCANFYAQVETQHPEDQKYDHNWMARARDLPAEESIACDPEIAV